MDQLEVELTHIDFWDVGQGDTTALHFSDKSILLIDVGPRGSPVVGWLAEHPQPIRAIILTHNDADHAGALCSIVAEHKHRIGAIYLLQDRPKKDEAFQKLFRCALEGERQGFYTLQNLETGKCPWESPYGKMRLRVLHPSFSEFIEAGTPNTTSAMLILECADEWLSLWPADLILSQVASKVGEAKPWIMVGPHHGCPEDYKKKPESVQCVERIAPRRGFISVGTRNGYSHPRPRYVQLLGKTGCQVVCSEITRWCDPETVKSGQDVFPGSAMLGLRAPPKGVACRGAWRVLCRNGTLVSDGYDDEHLARIAKLRRPLCLRGRGWKKGDPPPPSIH